MEEARPVRLPEIRDSGHGTRHANHSPLELAAARTDSGGAMKYAICLLGGALMAAGGASVLEVLGVGFLAMAFAWPRGQ